MWHNKKSRQTFDRRFGDRCFCYFLLGSGRHAKQTKPPNGLVALLILGQCTKKPVVSSH
jgi:hypothetical protein